MTLPLWGGLEKAQDDNQTIVEAIDAAIVAHEADPDSHLGAGESLEQHKTESVIDHPVASIVADKTTVQEYHFDTTFESLAGFTITSHVDPTSWPGVNISYWDPQADLEYIKANLLSLMGTGNLTHDFQFDTYFYNDVESGVAIIYVGVCNSAMSQFELGFKLVGRNIIGFARWSGSEHVTATLYTPVYAEVVFVRVFYDYEANVIHFYVNGVEQATLEPTATLTSNNQFAFHVDAQTEESGIMRIFRLTLAIGS